MFGLRITVLSGPDAGTEHTILPPEGIVGRAPSCAVRLSARGVSNAHASFESQTGAVWTVRDLGSTNGTFVGDKPVGLEPTELPEDGDFRVGIHALRYQRVPLADLKRADLKQADLKQPELKPSALRLPVDADAIPMTVVGKVRTDPSIHLEVRSRAPDSSEQRLAVVQAERDELAQLRTLLESRIEATEQAATTLRSSHAILERNLEAAKRSSQVLWDERRAFELQTVALRGELKEAQETVRELRSECAVLRATLKPIQEQLDSLQEKYSILRELNELLAKSMPEVQKEGRLLSTLWRETTLLRVHNQKLVRQNHTLHETLALEQAAHPVEMPPAP